MPSLTTTTILLQQRFFSRHIHFSDSFFRCKQCWILHIWSVWSNIMRHLCMQRFSVRRKVVSKIRSTRSQSPKEKIVLSFRDGAVTYSVSYASCSLSHKIIESRIFATKTLCICILIHFFGPLLTRCLHIEKLDAVWMLTRLRHHLEPIHCICSPYVSHARNLVVHCSLRKRWNHTKSRPCICIPFTVRFQRKKCTQFLISDYAA